MVARRVCSFALVSGLCGQPAGSEVVAPPARLSDADTAAQGGEDGPKRSPAPAALRRREALARARLWRQPSVPIEEADLRHNPGGAGTFDYEKPLSCRFLPRKTSGRTPKFYCSFEGGEVLKVKYGRNPEIHSEVAATRLLHALGAGADRVYLVRRLRCFGCPKNPQDLLSCISSPSEAFRRACRPVYGTLTDGAFVVQVDYAAWVDFGPVAIERALEGEEVRTDSVEGWGFVELDREQAGAGPARRAERDALRLLAVLLGNWDNKRDNQKLLCLPGGARTEDGRCSRPFAYMSDVGATFGRAGAERRQRKLDLEAWRAAPVWDDPETCRVRIASPRLHGSTFGTVVISDPGRVFLAARIGRLTRRQMRDLFEGSGFADAPGASPSSRDLDGWAQALEDKIQQVTGRTPCPAA